MPLNCGAMPDALTESILFGHEKGSFTGASSDKRGLFEAANGGTIFLDEIGEMPLTAQVKLLRALQEKEIVRVGATRHIKVDVRVIAETTNSATQKSGDDRENETGSAHPWRRLSPLPVMQLEIRADSVKSVEWSSSRPSYG